MSDVLLSVRGLRKWFELRKGFFSVAGHVRAVDGVSLDVPRGMSVSIIGESGCGKSTLARTIIGLYRPNGGSIILDGVDVTRMGKRELMHIRRSVGYVQQDPYGSLPPFMSIKRILLEPLIVNDAVDVASREKRVREVLTDVMLTPVEDFLGKYPHMLSGGQQQRVCIARALIVRPKLIVADEPVSMLDASIRIEILSLFRELQRKYGLSTIYITHDLSTTRFFSELVCIMYAGKIVEKGRVEDVLHDPLHPYTKALLKAIPAIDPKGRFIVKDVIGGEPPSLVNPPSGCRFHPRCPAAMAGICNVKEPPEFDVGGGRKVACWLYSEDLKSSGDAG